MYRDDSGCSSVCWETRIYFYKNREIDWQPEGGGFAAKNWDGELGWNGGQPNVQDAETLARADNNRSEISLSTSDCLKFVAEDGRGSYDDNRGSIIVTIKILAN